jgi:hypothetical protein
VFTYLVDVERADDPVEAGVEVVEEIHHLMRDGVCVSGKVQPL